MKEGRLIKTINQIPQMKGLKREQKKQSCSLYLLGAWIFTADIILHRTTQQADTSLKTSAEPPQTWKH